jgi:two-component system phosphate regulon sensor histidine kinase PhoR
MIKRVNKSLRVVLDSLPEEACLYLWHQDRLYPNARWKAAYGEMKYLDDLSRLGLDPQAVAERMEESSGPTEKTVALSLDKSGSRRLILAPIVESEGDVLFLVRDDAEVRRIEQLRRDFIANVSHELRTPLTAVRGYIETLLDPKFLTLDRVKEFLPIIFEHTERLHNLMLDLLSLSRLENPNTQIHIYPVCLADELENAVEATRPLAEMKNISMRLRKPSTRLHVMANPEHLERIMVNLLDNAIKYSPDGGMVSIWSEVHGPFVWTHVKDRGPGISSEELPRVFERFYRTRGAVGGKERGSGLGLAIVKHIVQQLGGEIKVASQVGKGSDFSFCLRLADHVPAAKNKSQERTSSPSAHSSSH